MLTRRAQACSIKLRFRLHFYFGTTISTFPSVWLSPSLWASLYNLAICEIVFQRASRNEVSREGWLISPSAIALFNLVKKMRHSYFNSSSETKRTLNFFWKSSGYFSQVIANTNCFFSTRGLEMNIFLNIQLPLYEKPNWIDSRYLIQYAIHNYPSVFISKFQNRFFKARFRSYV